MSFKVESSVWIHRPVAEVYAFVTDWEKYPMWEANVLEARQLSEGKAGVGVTCRQVSRFMGRLLETEGVITDCEPNLKYGFKATKAPYPWSACQVFREENGGTQITYTFESELSGLFRFMQPLTEYMARRSLAANYTRLKQILEA